jgi:hypothetical protein
MKSNILLLLIVCLFAIGISAQDIEAIQVDQIESFCCESVRAQLDSYLIEVKNDPDAKGYIIFYGGKRHPFCAGSRQGDLPRHGELSLLITTLEQHIKFRKFAPERIAWINGGYRENWSVEFWLASKNAAPPVPMPTVHKRDIKYAKGKPFSIGASCEQ